ncbi:MAG: hypothetical protein ACTSWR_02605 [Candidatus Helarchaeota archaeon]
MANLADELPDTIYIPLGRRGFQPINIKACIRCSMENKFVLEFLEKKINIEESDESKKEIIDYKVKCRNCNAIYYIRMIKIKKIVEEEGEKKEILVVTNFNILDEKGNDEGWLGTLYE